MAEYIERDKMREKIANLQKRRSHHGQHLLAEALDIVLIAIDKAPAADVAPVVHGRWDYHTHTMQECSVCKRHTARHRFNYCPNCGAHMKDGE